MKHFLLQAGLLFLLLPYPAQSQSIDKLSLQDVLMIALQSNLEVLRAQKEINAASGRVLQAGRIPNPEIGVTWNESPSSFNLGDADERDIGISQTIEFPTKRSHRVGVASLDKRITELNLERIKRLVTARVKKTYVALLFTQEIAENLQEQVKLLKDFQSLVTARYQAGQSNYLDVIRAKVEIARINNEIAEAFREVRLKEAELNLILGRSAENRIQAIDSLTYLPISLQRDSLLSEATQRSATLGLARHSLNRQKEFLSLSKTSYLPDFSLGLFHQRRAEEPPFNQNNFRGTTSNSLGFQVGISIPLWFWQEPKGQVQEASALLDVAAINLSQTEKSVRTSVLNAIDFVQVTDAQVRTFDTSLLKDASDILATAIAQYQNNQIDVLNLLDVYRTYRATRVEYARALSNYMIALAELEAAGELPAQE